MNNRLAALDSTTRAAQDYWQIYLKDWTRLNHVRTIGCLMTGALYITAAVLVTGADFQLGSRANIVTPMEYDTLQTSVIVQPN